MYMRMALIKVFNHRYNIWLQKKKILGVGTNFFIGDATFRGDAAFFNTSDVNDEDKFLERKALTYQQYMTHYIILIL